MSDNIDYTRLPLHMQESARAYVERGQPPEAFLRNVLANAFRGSIIYADSNNLSALAEWANWLLAIPFGAWGSWSNIDDWIAHRRRIAQEEAEQPEGDDDS